MTYGDPVIIDLQDHVDPQQLIIAPKHKTMDKMNRAKRQRKVMTLCEEIEVYCTHKMFTVHKIQYTKDDSWYI